jgi:hypothetical protein
VTLIDVHTAIRNVTGEFEALLQQRQIEIVFDVDESLSPIWGDADARHHSHARRPDGAVERARKGYDRAPLASAR